MGRFALRAPAHVAAALLATTAVFAAALVATAGATPGHHQRAPATRACAHAGTPLGPTSRHATKTAVVCLLNRERVGHGLPALRESRLLARSAQGWTNTMVATERSPTAPISRRASPRSDLRGEPPAKTSRPAS
jgi:uncharacterized protein YkwD